MSAGVQVERDGAVCWIRLDRPRRRNALAAAGWEALGAAFRDEGRRPGVRCIVLASTAGGSFCSGFDIGGDSVEDLFGGAAVRAATAAFDAFAAVEVPVVGLVDGPAHGGGCELALRCDLRLGTPRATFAVPAARYGLPYLPGGLAYLTRLLGPSVATWLFVGGETMPADAAVTAGLLHRIVPEEGLVAEGARLAGRIAAGAPLVHAYLKRSIRRFGEATTGTPAHHDAEQEFALILDSRDLAESRAALVEERPPRFEGR